MRGMSADGYILVNWPVDAIARNDWAIRKSFIFSEYIVHMGYHLFGLKTRSSPWKPNSQRQTPMKSSSDSFQQISNLELKGALLMSGEGSCLVQTLEWDSPAFFDRYFLLQWYRRLCFSLKKHICDSIHMIMSDGYQIIKHDKHVWPKEAP